jgi:hypothetical protein
MKLSEFTGNETNKTAVVAALAEFKKTKPYRGTTSERVEKWKVLTAALSTLLGESINFYYVPNCDEDPEGDASETVIAAVEADQGKKIVLAGKFSIITTLSQFFGLFEPDNELAKFDPHASYDSDETAQVAYEAAVQSVEAWKNQLVDAAYEFFKEVWPKLAANLVKSCGRYVKKPAADAPVLVPGPSSIQ